MAIKVYLTKVHVQTFWVEIDEETGVATEMSDGGMAVSAKDWPSFHEAHSSDFAMMKAERENIDQMESVMIEKEK